jgi:hypothetical protein
MDTQLQIKAGEKSRVGKTVTATDGSTVGIDATTTTFEVKDSDDNVTQASALATVADDDTTSPDVYGFVDTTTGTWTVGTDYRVIFTITFDDGEIDKPITPFEVITA